MLEYAVAVLLGYLLGAIPRSLLIGVRCLTAGRTSGRATSATDAARST